MTHRVSVRSVRRGHELLSDIVGSAVVSAMNKADKWCDEQLTDAQRRVIEEQTEHYLWIVADEMGVEVK